MKVTSASLFIMKRRFSKVRNQHGNYEPGCFIILGAIGVLYAVLIPLSMSHVDRIEASGGAQETIWTAKFIWLGSPIVLLVLATIIATIFGEINHQKKTLKKSPSLALYVFGVISIIFTAAVIVVLVSLAFKYF